MTPEASDSKALRRNEKLSLPVMEERAPSQAESAEHEPTPGQPVRMLQVGDLAKAAGKTVRAIHLYEELGLLRPSKRSKGRYRLYGPDALTRARWIGKLQELGMSLQDIRTVVQEWESSPSAPGAMSRMSEVYRSKLLETREQISRLVSLEHELAASLAYLETCDACDPARLLSSCFSCEMHCQAAQAPELVAGLSAHAHRG